MNDQQKNTGFLNFVSELVKKFGPAEKMIFIIAAMVLIVSGFTIVVKTNNLFLVEVPAQGGVLKEGMIGNPRFVNPVLAISDTDKSISELVYGQLVPDLAKSLKISDDGLTYDLVLKDKAQFHDGKPVTADDIIFTIDKILDPVIKSPRRAEFDGVTLEKVNDKEVRFILKKPYSPFVENLSIGILPAHVWQDVTSEQFPFSDKNISPIGAGPFKIDTVSKDGSGIPTGIILKSFSKYAALAPKINEIDLSFFGNETDGIEAYKSGSISALGGLNAADADVLKDALGTQVISSVMPRIFGVFFNQNQATIFSNIEVRKALDAALDKEAISNEINKSFGVPLSGPTPLDIWKNELTATTSKEITYATSTPRIEAAKNILIKAGWKINKDEIWEKKTSKETL
ncbi:MAG TPA: ABC transporter substrate-binding protein, partial [Candidatus Paceibacterota bacterium]|nr:ABC transporter substrate-binding protein [Candidatus Paceibacterota bacterium]